jgi:hypothetical protein
VNGHVEPRSTRKCDCAACAREHGKRFNAKQRPEREARKAQRKAEREAQREARKSDPVLIAERQAKARAAARAWQRKKLRRRMREISTEGAYAEQAEESRIQYANNIEAQRQRGRERYRKGEKGNSIWIKRVPPWVSDDERRAMKAFYKDRPPGMSVDHIVPFGHPLVAGLHVLANLQYLPSRENIRRGNRIVYTHAEALELIRLGLAVWRTDVGDDGVIDWSAYAVKPIRL